MKHIEFQYVEFKNFFSFGNLVFKYDFITGTTLLCGENGSGKTTVFNATRYALFGTVDRDDMKIGGIVNNVNQKGCYVVLVFKINETVYRIERGIKPNKFIVYVDDKELEIDSKKSVFQKEKLEEKILGFDESLFLKFFSIDSDYPSFFSAKKKDRETFINNFVDFDTIDILKKKNTNMSSEINSEVSGITGELRGLEYSLREYIADAKAIKERATVSDLLAKKEEESVHLLDKVETLQLTIELAEKELELIIVPDVDNVEEAEHWKEYYHTTCGTMHIDMEKIRSEKTSIERYIKDMQSVKFEFDSCMDELKERILKDQEAVDKLQEKYLELKSQRSRIVEIADALEDYYDDLVKLVKDAESKTKEVMSLTEQLAAHLAKLKGVDEDIADIKKKEEDDKEQELAEIQEKIETILAKKKELEAEVEVYDVKLQFSKDLQNILNKKVKAYYISKIRPFINNKLSHYLGILKIPFIVEFVNDDMTEIVFKSIAQRGFSYGNLSKGQKKTLDLALILSFRDLFEINRAITSNLFIFDEYFSNISESRFLTVIEGLHDMKPEASISITLHNKHALDQIKCDRQFTFEHDGTFSHVKLEE